MTKLFLYHSGNPDKDRGLLLVLTGVAAINIDGTTIYSGLNIPCHGKNVSLKCQKSGITEKQIFKLLFPVHQRLIEIFESPSNIPFTEKYVILCGDLYQLPLVRAKSVFMFDEDSQLLQGAV